MKRYIRSDSVTATTYKQDDPRIPLIKAIENVLKIPYHGSKYVNWKDTDYSEPYGMSINYKITREKKSTDAYKLTIEPIFEEGIKDGKFNQYYIHPHNHQTKAAESKILKDMEKYINSNYPELDTRCASTVDYAFIVCDAVRPSSSTKDVAKQLAENTIDLIKDSEYDIFFDEFSYTIYNTYVQVRGQFSNFRDDIDDQYLVDLRNFLISNGLDVKKVYFLQGKVQYPIWIDPSVAINISL